MRNALKRKLKSQRGASMLLALMFLLICMMVTSSILVASVSNSAKNHSNMEQHQQYMTISSAMSAICDELNRSAYRGQYTYRVEEEIVNDAEGNYLYTIYHYFFHQQDGSYQIQDTTTEAYLKKIVLPNFDGMFGAEIKRLQEILKQGKAHSTLELTVNGPAPKTKYSLTVEPETKTPLDQPPVEVELQITEEYIIELRATLGDYRMQAELTPKTGKPTLKNPTPQGAAIQQTEPLQWEISWITPAQKEEAKP